jgi:hypothetical protein
MAEAPDNSLPPSANRLRGQTEKENPPLIVAVNRTPSFIRPAQSRIEELHRSRGSF